MRQAGRFFVTYIRRDIINSMNNAKFQHGIAPIIIVLILTAAGAVLWLYQNSGMGGWSKIAGGGRILSFAVEPSRKEGGWTLYTYGAKAIFKGEKLLSVELRYSPTGAGAGNGQPDGYKLGNMARLERCAAGQECSPDMPDMWFYNMPKNLTATNFWAVAKDAQGNTLKSNDLGNVGYEE